MTNDWATKFRVMVMVGVRFRNRNICRAFECLPADDWRSYRPLSITLRNVFSLSLHLLFCLIFIVPGMHFVDDLNFKQLRK